jgi:serine/threonine-protein kinase
LLVVASGATVGNGVSWVRSDGAGEPQKILEERRNNTAALSFSPDGRRLAYSDTNPETGYDLWTLTLDLTDPDHPKPGKPELFLRSPADERGPKFPPNGRWIAYRSNESGKRGDLRPAISGWERRQMADFGGWRIEVLWSNNGRELFYETTDHRIMVADYPVAADSFVPGKPRLWSDKQLFSTGSSNLDLAPDGKRFAVLALPETAPGEKHSVHVTMLLNFFDELRRRVPAK